MDGWVDIALHKGSLLILESKIFPPHKEWKSSYRDRLDWKLGIECGKEQKQ